MSEQRGYRVGEVGSLVNLLQSAEPRDRIKHVEVGMGCTILGWSDRYPATVIEVRNRDGKRPVVVIRRDRYEVTEGYSNAFTENQHWDITEDPEGRTHEVLFRKGAWRIRGTDEAIRFGDRERYDDPSF